MIGKLEALSLGYDSKHIYNVLIPKEKYSLEKIKYFIERNIKNPKLEYIETNKYYEFQQTKLIKNSKLLLKKLTNDIIFIYQMY